MKDQRKAEDIAAERMKWLSPLLESGLDSAKAQQVKQTICKQTGLSERTLRRYMEKYKREGFQGLKPKSKSRARGDAIPTEILELAIELRREVPKRSVSQIIQILEWNENVRPGTVKRSTLQEKLTERGYSSRQMRLYASSGVASRRFQKLYRNDLWQSDIKFGPYLPIGPGGKPQQVYLVLFVDDATRYVLNGAFYATQDRAIVADSFRKAIQQYGKPQAVYFDNGKQFRNRGMGRTCAKLGIRLLFARPYAAESKGKVERLNQTVDSFLNEVALEKPKTLEQLNQWFQTWLSECYQNQPHSAVGEQTTPRMAFQNSKTPLQFVDSVLLADAFLLCESRKVDKAGCISFQGKKYEVGLHVIGRKVDVVYDLADITTITIECEGLEAWTARELVIGERAGKRPSLPESMTPKPADNSKLLRGAQQQQMKRRAVQQPAVTYRAVHREVETDV